MRRREFFCPVRERSGMVACSRAAAGDAGNRIPQRGVASQVHATHSRFPPRIERSGLRRGSELAVEHRWAEGQVGRLPALAADLVNRQVAVLVTGGSLAAVTARSATTTIPIVFNATDPVRLGLAISLSRPGGNPTGVNVLAGDLGPKRLGCLHCGFQPSQRPNPIEARSVRAGDARVARSNSGKPASVTPPDVP